MKAANQNTSQYTLQSSCAFFLPVMVFFLTSCGLVTSPEGRLLQEGETGVCRYVTGHRVSQVPLPPPVLKRTPEVERELRKFTESRRKFMARMLERTQKHREQMVNILKREGIPSEMLNLAMIESGFRADARSPAGAVGMWQFVKSTARVYGLVVNLFEDQRLDPILSTVAAARHLRDLYNAYQDWYLALAAYNGGTAAVDRAIMKAGTRDFWSIARGGFLREETRNFVARFIAASLVHSFLVENRMAMSLDGPING